MLTKANFSTSVSNSIFGIELINYAVTRTVGITNEGSYLTLFFNPKPTDDNHLQFTVEYTNGFERAVIYSTNTADIYRAIARAFRQIDITFDTESNGDFLKPEEFDFFINQKIY